ncbi:MAG TPA: hypothetical protein VGR44_12215 [Methylomirabilota bacterium]|nr:hypothetical protein [Methylomirabilota bacterium]
MDSDGAVHHVHRVDGDARAYGFVQPEDPQELLADYCLRQRPAAVLVGDVGEDTGRVPGLEALAGPGEGGLELLDRLDRSWGESRVGRG